MLNIIEVRLVRQKFWVAGGILLLAVLLPFQNCTSSTTSHEKNGASTGTQFGGNGEGYTGKVDGTYATLDTNATCGAVAGNKFKVKDKVEVTNGQMAYTVKDCAPLLTPQSIANPNLTTVQSKGEIFVLDTQMFQKGGFINSGEASPEQFVDFYCAGWDNAAPSVNVKRRVELAMFKGTEAFITTPFYDQTWRKGLMRLIDLNATSGAPITDNIYNLDPLVQGNLPGLGFFITPFFPGPDDFWFEYYEPNGVAPFDPNMTYTVNGGTDRTADPMTCWQTF